MNFFEHIINLFKRSANTGVLQGSLPIPPRYGGNFMPMSRGNALSIAAVYRCVNLLADSVANLPMQFMRLKDGIFVEDTNSRLHYLLTVQPNPNMSAFDFWRLVTEYILLEGNAYIVPIYDAVVPEVGQLYIVPSSSVQHDILKDTYTVDDQLSGIKGTYREDEIIHIKNYSMDGKTGVSTLTYARLTTDIALTGDNETLNRFANGGNVRGLVGNDSSNVRGFGKAQQEQLEQVAESLDERFSHGEKIVSLPSQVQFTPISLSSTDMQFLESRKYTLRDICRFFGVHPSFVFDDTSNNYKSAESANVAFLSTTLNPLLRRIENELLRKLIAPSLCCKRKFEFDRRGLYACDLESRIKYQAQTIAAGIYTVNEWRKSENKPAVEGGDTVLVSANLKSLQDTKTIEPKNEPQKEPENEEGQE